MRKVVHCKVPFDDGASVRGERFVRTRSGAGAVWPRTGLIAKGMALADQRFADGVKGPDRVVEAEVPCVCSIDRIRQQRIFARSMILARRTDARTSSPLQHRIAPGHFGTNAMLNLGVPSVSRIHAKQPELGNPCRDVRRRRRSREYLDFARGAFLRF